MYVISAFSVISVIVVTCVIAVIAVIAVTAVIAVIAKEPREVTDLISAWMPAPPEESDPAIINILDLIFNLLDWFFYNIYTQFI